MSAQAIEPFAVADAIRTTLELFMSDHPEMDGVDLEIAEHTETDGSFGVTVCGIPFEVMVGEPGR